MNQISFRSPLNNNKVILIRYQNKGAGEIYLDNDFIITDTNIHFEYLDILKKHLLHSLLFNYGINDICLVTKPKYIEYYKEFGFKTSDVSNKSKNIIKMKFCTGEH